jgi:hypothetical protein
LGRKRAAKPLAARFILPINNAHHDDGEKDNHQDQGKRNPQGSADPYPGPSDSAGEFQNKKHNEQNGANSNSTARIRRLIFHKYQFLSLFSICIIPYFYLFVKYFFSFGEDLFFPKTKDDASRIGIEQNAEAIVGAVVAVMENRELISGQNGFNLLRFLMEDFFSGVQVISRNSKHFYWLLSFCTFIITYLLEFVKRIF